MLCAGDLWDSGCIDLLWDLANTVDGQKKVLVAKVILFDCCVNFFDYQHLLSAW